MSNLAILGGKPACDLKPNYASGNPELERKYLLEAYDSGMWDNWPGMDSQAAKFAQEWADFCNAKYCLLVTNGTHTLQLAMEALGVGPGDEVIVPGATWQATASTVCDVNAVPILVDIDPTTGCIDPAKVEQAITPRTKGIIPVHLYGRTADMDRLGALASKHNLFIIEDCAHAHGSRWDNKGVGSIGTVGSYSFQRSKTMTGGEGGALITNDETLYRKLESMRMCGRDVDGVSVHSGNYRMTSLQAAVMRGQLAWLQSRGADQMDGFHRAFDAALKAAGIPGIAPLRRSEHITRQCGYGISFLFDGKAWGGLRGWPFRKALGAETNMGWGSVYEPLNNSSVYRPHTKRRHHLSEEYLKAITPSRFELPVCREMFMETLVTAEWKFMLSPHEKIADLVQVLGKLWNGRQELLDAQAKGVIK